MRNLSLYNIDTKGQLIYKNYCLPLTGVFQSEAWRGKRILHSLIFTYDESKRVPGKQGNKG